MEMREFEGTGIRASVVGLGCNNFGIYQNAAQAVAIDAEKAAYNEHCSVGLANSVCRALHAACGAASAPLSPIERDTRRAEHSGQTDDRHVGGGRGIARTDPPMDPTTRLAHSSTLYPSRSGGTPTGRSGTTHGRQNMNTRVQAEERKRGLKDNTSCASPAPIQHFAIIWL
jgi:hypothetical protein